jgi:ATP-dependent DNA helicase PIF1
MIGIKLLARIDARLREIRPEFNDRLFRGMTVVLFGDFGEEPPVCDPVLYALVSDKSPATIRNASKLYHECFLRAFSLTEQMRQQSQSDLDLTFQLALSHLGMGHIMREDWEILQSRVLPH